jgi:hypothetical protein
MKKNQKIPEMLHLLIVLKDEFNKIENITKK